MAELFYAYGKDDLDLKWEIKSGDVKFIIEKSTKKPFFRRSSGEGAHGAGMVAHGIPVTTPSSAECACQTPEELNSLWKSMRCLSFLGLPRFSWNLL